MSYFLLSSLLNFLNTTNNAVTNLNPLSSDNVFISLILIVDSVFLSCNSVLKEFEITTLQVLA